MLMVTFTPFAVVDPDVLLLLLLLLKLLKLQAYPPRYNEIEPPYTCTKNSHHSASHSQPQYEAGGADPKALTLEEPGLEKSSARGTRVRSGTLKQAGTLKTYD